MKKYLKKYTYPFFESIRLVDGEPQLLDYHQRRIDHVFKFAYPYIKPISLIDLTPSIAPKGICKWRISYNQSASTSSVELYEPQQIEKFVPVTCNISYPMKYTDRSIYTAMNQACDKDEVPLIITDDRLRETNYGNIILKIDQVWYTPMYPIFYGVMRQYLIVNNLVTERDLFMKDFHDCDAIQMINAMRPPRF